MIDLRLGDCLEVMKDIPDKSIDLTVTSPPYEVELVEQEKTIIETIIKKVGK